MAVFSSVPWLAMLALRLLAPHGLETADDVLADSVVQFAKTALLWLTKFWLSAHRLASGM